MSGTNWYSFSANSLTDATKVNFNFDWMEGNLVPMTDGNMTTGVYDLGTSTYQWRNGYLNTSIVINSSTISGTIVDGTSVALSSGSLQIKSQGVRGSTANSGGSPQEISQGTISTPDLRANAVTNIQLATSGGTNNTGTTITIASIVTNGGKVLVSAHLNLSLNTQSASSGIAFPGLFVSYKASIYRQEPAGTITTWAGGAQSSALNWWVMSTTVLSLNIYTVDQNPPTGTMTYGFLYDVVWGSSPTLGFYNLSVIELKK